jgi:hypothetical protein
MGFRECARNVKTRKRKQEKTKMKIKTVAVGKTRSVKVANYQYFKPQVYLEAEVDESHSVKETQELLSITVDQMLNDIEKEEELRFSQIVKRRELEQVMDEHEPHETEYKLAQKALKEMGVL